MLQRVTPSSRSSRSSDHWRSRRDSPEDILMTRIIETVQNRRLVKEETTEIMILKEADMKVQGEPLLLASNTVSPSAADVDLALVQMGS
ncbi:hypothetical protein Tco_1181352 [Tanacetum coccineum]